jgi:hypothetical protein
MVGLLLPNALPACRGIHTSSAEDITLPFSSSSTHTGGGMGYPSHSPDWISAGAAANTLQHSKV